MMERTKGTKSRASKGRMASPPPLDGILATVAEAVASWPSVSATAHWALYDASRIDGIDFYVGQDELGHIHLDGWIHLATNPSLARSLIAEGLAQRFPYGPGWVQQQIGKVCAAAAIALFKRNYDRFAHAERENQDAA